jgi:hypothetical protein
MRAFVAFVAAMCLALSACEETPPWEDDVAEESLTSSSNPLTTPIGCFCTDSGGNVYESKVDVWPWQDLAEARRRCFDDIAATHGPARGLQCERAESP